MAENKMSEIFEQLKKLVCKDAKLTIRKIKRCKCKDIIAGYYDGTTDDKAFWFSKKERDGHDTSIENNKEIKKLGKVETIVVILESPHIKEFFEEPNGPANGSSGTNLQKYFWNVLKQIFKEHENLRILQYRIILMNSIQYQCSLGVDPKRFRDHVWLKLWYESDLKNDFSERLQNYNPKIILNLCTLGDHSLEQGLPQGCKTVINNKYLEYCLSKNRPKLFQLHVTLQKLVSQQIPNNLLSKGCVVYTAYHPARIWSGDNNNICDKIKLEDITSALVEKSSKV